MAGFGGKSRKTAVVGAIAGASGGVFAWTGVLFPVPERH